MGLFDGLFKKKEMAIGSPMAGKCIPMTEVNDPTFSGEFLGKGAAIQPADGKVYAPADGKISTVFPTGHAIGMTTPDGVEILIHIGIDTVKLKGEHFTIKAGDGQEVKKGDLLIEADLEQIKAAGYEVVTPVIICNTAEFSSVEGITGADVKPGDDIIRVAK